MDEKMDMTPELTLDPSGAGAAAAAEATLKAPEAPTLTLEPTLGAEESAAAQKERDANAVKIDESMLTEAERKMVNDFAEKIDITDSNVVLQYGAAAQKNVASFSENTLNSVRTKDLGEVGEALSSLVVQLKGFDVEEKKGIFGFFQRKRNELEEMKVAYSKAETNVDKIVQILEQHQVTLMKDIAMLDQMYDLNTKYYKELTMYIIAGKKKLQQVREKDLEELRKKAAASGAQEDAQAYNDLANMCSRFEKKLHDLELTRMISIQMGPQTRLIQNNDTLMLEKIQSSLVNTIPLWKSQMVLALGLEHSRQATAAQSAVTNMTNELLQKNADMLKMGTVETAKEAERSIVDIQTLQHTNQQLISTLDEVMKIQQEGAQKRKEAEVELGRIEGELKQKLLELRG
ncbi:MAG TPA: toxic anion resistance protein [Candidatus Galloscillospira excrementavium]|nr:toxic anion resistance protein [Candidatus Galloscillospira excrementavium]